MKRLSLSIRVILKLALAVLPLNTGHAAESPLIVLVHGANFSSASWRWVQDDLGRYGVESAAISLYSADENVDLATVSSRLCEQVKSFHRPVVLVGHSQGGAIITEASAQCGSSVDALVYVAAVVPRSGEGVFDDLSQADNDSYANCGYLDPKTDTYVLRGLAPCRDVFFADAPPEMVSVAFATLVSEPAGIGNSQASYSSAGLSAVPKYYIETSQDRIISPDTQKKIVAKEPFRRIYTLESSHSPFFGKHQELSAILTSIRAEVAR